VVADAGVHRHAVDHVAIRLEEREEPVVVFIPLRADRQAQDAGARADVVASSEDEPHVVLVEGVLHRFGDLALAARRRGLPDAGAVVAEDHEGERPRRFGRRVGVRAELVDVASAPLHESLRVPGRPIPSFIFGPHLVLDDHLVAIARVGREPGDPAEVRRFGEARRRQRPVHVVDVHARGPVRIRARADALAARRMHVAQIVVVDELPFVARACLEVKRAPGDER